MTHKMLLLISLVTLAPKACYSMDNSPMSLESSTDCNAHAPLQLQTKISVGDQIPNYRVKVPEDQTAETEPIKFSLREFLTEGDRPIKTLILISPVSNISMCQHLTAAITAHAWFAEHEIAVVVIYPAQVDCTHGWVAHDIEENGRTSKACAFFLGDPNVEYSPNLLPCGKMTIISWA